MGVNVYAPVPHTNTQWKGALNVDDVNLAVCYSVAYLRLVHGHY